MNKRLEPVDALGLLANGSSGRWDISVDESLNGREREWSLEIDGPQAYLVFRLRDLNVVRKALCYLELGLALHQTGAWCKREDQESPPILGRFGPASVSLLWDKEEFPRCFIVIGAEARSTLRLTLDREDIPMFVEALRQVADGLSSAACDPGTEAENGASTGGTLLRKRP
jgi:hypothetical protein